MEDKENEVPERKRDPKRQLALVLLSALAIGSVVYAIYTIALAFLSLSKDDTTVEVIGDLTTGKEETSDKNAIEIAQALSFAYNADCMVNGLSWLDME